MSKILLPTIDYPPARGGVARYIGAITETYPDQVRLLKLKKVKLDNLVLRLILQAKTYEVIWTHHVLPIGTAAYLAKRFTGKPYVVFLHGLDFDLARRNSWKRWLAKLVLGGAARIVTNSQALATEVRAFIEAEREPLVVYPTLEDQFIEAAKPPRGTREKVNLQKLAELAMGVSRAATPMFVANKSKAANTPLRLLTVARLVERKGHLKVLEAMAKLPQSTYHIVGDGPMLNEINLKIKELGLRDRVTISRYISDEELPDVYRHADVFVMPTLKTATDREGFGIVYLEAQLFGLPVIACRHPGVDEAVRDGEGGLLIGDSVDDVVRAIERLQNPGVRLKFGARGKAWVEHTFTREQQMYRLRELL